MPASSGLYTHRVRTELFLFWVKSEDERGHIGRAPIELPTCQQPLRMCQSDFFNLATRHQPPSPGRPSKNKTLTRTRIHTHTHIHTGQLTVFLFVLCHIPAGLLEELEACGWVLCLLIGWWQTNQASQKYTRQGNKRQRQTQIAWGMGGTNPIGGFFFPPLSPLCYLP